MPCRKTVTQGSLTGVINREEHTNENLYQTKWSYFQGTFPQMIPAVQGFCYIITMKTI